MKTRRSIPETDLAKKGPRKPSIHLEGGSLFAFDELAEMTREIYAIWEDGRLLNFERLFLKTVEYGKTDDACDYLPAARPEGPQ